MKDNLVTNFCIADTFPLRVGYVFVFSKKMESVHTKKTTFFLFRMT